MPWLNQQTEFHQISTDVYNIIYLIYQIFDISKYQKFDILIFCNYHDFWWFSLVFMIRWSFMLNYEILHYTGSEKLPFEKSSQKYMVWYSTIIGQNHSKPCKSRPEHNTVSCSMVKSWKIAKYQICDILIYHENEKRFSKNHFTDGLRIIYWMI